jgi:hypothetical protein
MNDRGQFPAGAGIFFSSPSRSAQPHVQWVPEDLILKWPGRKDNHSPPSSAEANNACSYTSTTPIRLHGAVLN